MKNKSSSPHSAPSTQHFPVKVWLKAIVTVILAKSRFT